VKKFILQRTWIFQALSISQSFYCKIETPCTNTECWKESAISKCRVKASYNLLKQTWTGELCKKYTYFVNSDRTTSNSWSPFLYELKLIATLFQLLCHIKGNAGHIIMFARYSKVARSRLFVFAGAIIFLNWKSVAISLSSYRNGLQLLLVVLSELTKYVYFLHNSPRQINRWNYWSVHKYLSLLHVLNFVFYCIPMTTDRDGVHCKPLQGAWHQ
jgi:hypothetical protein